MKQPEPSVMPPRFNAAVSQLAASQKVPLCIDLFCGLGGWAEGFLAEGWRVIGYDIERHRYPKIATNGEDTKNTGGSWFNIPGPGGIVANRNPVHQLTKAATTQSSEWMEYPGELILQDVLTLHGSQFKDADCIVASPPCTEFSYLAMPWSRGKQIATALRGKGEFPAGYKGSRTIKEMTALFFACFRIQREACEAAGRHIPMVVENVRGAQPWVGRARWNFGSFYLWGDVPALMPITAPRPVMKYGITCRPGETNFHGYKSKQGRSMNKGEPKWNTHHADHMAELGIKVNQRNGHSHTRHLTNPAEHVKGPEGGWFNDNKRNGKGETGYLSRSGSKSNARKAASAMIAKIPLVLARHIARVYKPRLDTAPFPPTLSLA